MTHPTHGTDLAKPVKNFTGRRPWPGDHLYRIYDVTTRVPSWICRSGLRRKRPATPAPHETSPIKLLPRLAVTCTPNP